VSLPGGAGRPRRDRQQRRRRARLPGGHDFGYAAGCRGSGEALRVAWQNLLRLSFGLGYFQLALPVDAVRAAIGAGGVRLALLHAVCHATLLIALWGFWLSAREGLRTLHLYAAGYGAIVLIWTFSPYRFLVPWTPFLIYFAATGLRAALRARWLAGIAYAAVLALFLPGWNSRAHPSRPTTRASLDRLDGAARRRALLREHEPDDVSPPRGAVPHHSRRGANWPDTDRWRSTTPRAATLQQPAGARAAGRERGLVRATATRRSPGVVGRRANRPGLLGAALDAAVRAGYTTGHLRDLRSGFGADR
jgi:hypothetical protein